MRVEVAQPVQNLTRHGRELRFRKRTLILEQRVQRAQFHILHHNRHVAGGLLEEPVTPHDVRRVGPAVDVHFPPNLTADDGVGVAVDDLEGVDGRGALVADLVDGAAVAMTEDLKLLEVVWSDLVGSGGGVGGGGGREGKGEARATLGGLREGEAEIKVAAIADESHGGRREELMREARGGKGI